MNVHVTLESDRGEFNNVFVCVPSLCGYLFISSVLLCLTLLLSPLFIIGVCEYSVYVCVCVWMWCVCVCVPSVWLKMSISNVEL